MAATLLVVSPGASSAAPEPPSADVVRAAQLVTDSPAWPRVTMEARDKIALCAAAGPIDARSTTSAHRVGEMFHTFVSTGAVDAYRVGNALPVGAAVSKRTFDPQTEATTSYFVMWKVSDGEWRYGTAGADGAVIRAGALADCAGCHEKQREQDFLFRRF
jgi:hypothetical protein